MKIFIIHKGSDFDEVNKILAVKKSEDFNFKPLMLQNNAKKLWKSEAKHLLNKADRVIYFVGKEFSVNIEWEIKTAKKAGLPLYFVKLDESYKINDALYINDGYDKKPIGTIKKLEELDSIITDSTKELQEKLFNKENVDTNLLWEQYKLMLETSERLVERRQKISVTYLSILSIIIPIISSMLVIENRWVNLVTIILSILSIVLCMCWQGIVKSYGKSNSAKFKIMELIEENLPVNLFKSEWAALKYEGKRYVSFTERETSIPKFFIFINAIFIVIAIVIFTLKTCGLF